MTTAAAKYDTINPKKGGGVCMKGGIYQDKKRSGSWIVRFPGIWKRFPDKFQAERFLNMVRYKHDEGTYDPKEFKPGHPLGFSTLADQWIDFRSERVRCKRNIVRHMGCAKDYFKQQYVREMRYRDIEDYLGSLPQTLSDKTKANYLTTLHAFWT